MILVNARAALTSGAAKVRVGILVNFSVIRNAAHTPMENGSLTNIL